MSVMHLHLPGRRDRSTPPPEPVEAVEARVRDLTGRLEARTKELLDLVALGRIRAEHSRDDEGDTDD